MTGAFVDVPQHSGWCIYCLWSTLSRNHAYLDDLALIFQAVCVRHTPFLVCKEQLREVTLGTSY